MNKVERQELIKSMIRKAKIRTQADIQQELERQGISVTQTTLSRDLRELGLVKVHENGLSYYILPDSRESIPYSQLLAEHAYKVERASFILVLHSKLGEAALLANVIDVEKPETILGTLTGADTLLVICRDEAAAQQVEAEIKSYLD